MLTKRVTGCNDFVSDYSRTQAPATQTFILSRRVLDDVFLTRETTIRRAGPVIARNERLIVEGSGAAGVAALLDGRVHARSICVFLTGGNIDGDLFDELRRELDEQAPADNHRGQMT